LLATLQQQPFLRQMFTGIAELMKLATINEEDGR
jgi:hypothetical protein